VCGPVSPTDARLRRAQALAHQNGKALEISRELIRAKLEGQERVVREQLKDSTTADVIARFRERVSAAENLDAVRRFERESALAYWRAWHDVPIQSPRNDVKRCPSHWLRFLARRSPLTGGPRLAVNPPNAILNYCFALAESECRLAVSALGLDPGIGFIHVDTPNRDSLALDLLETIRPSIEAWLLDWITREPLKREWFFEERNGNCRLLGSFCSKLSTTALTWGKLAAPYAEYTARTLWSGHQSSGVKVLATRLTQAHRRKAKGHPPLPRVEAPRTEHVCRGCGKEIIKSKHYCVDCAKVTTIESFDAGRKQAHQPQFLAKRSATQKAHRRAIKDFKPSELPSWLTRGFYANKIRPALANVPKSNIRSALRVSEPYSSDIRSGKRVPHPRHWQRLAKMVSLSPEW